jgi:hypothetical protein
MPKFNNICVISYTPSPDRRQDRTRLRPDYRVSTGPRRQRPELRPRDDRRATKRGPGYTLVDAYRTFTVGIIYPYTTAGVLYTVSPKPVGTARPAIILHRAVEQRGAARAEPLQRSSRRSAPEGSAPIAPRALLARLLTRLLSSRIARRCARARAVSHATCHVCMHRPALGCGANMHARPMPVLTTALYLPRRARRSGVGAPGPPCPWKSASSSSSSTSASACSLGVLAGVIEALCF